MDGGQTLMSNTISGIVDCEEVSAEVASNKERTSPKRESETATYEGYKELGESSVENIGFMSVVEPEVRRIEEGEDQKGPVEIETEPKRFISVASFSLTNVTVPEGTSFYETDPDESADNLEYFVKNKRLVKTTSGFSGDDEESCGEEEPFWSTPATSSDEHKRNVDLKKVEGSSLNTSIDSPKSSGYDIEVQVHHDSIEDSTSNDDVERLNVSKNSDDSFSEIHGVSDSVKPTTGIGVENQTSETVSKPTRIPWTTRLIQKLTEEENRKKLRTEDNLKQARKIRIPPKRSAIYERTDKSSPWLQRPSKNTENATTGRAEHSSSVVKTDSGGIGGKQEATRNQDVSDGGVKTVACNKGDLENDNAVDREKQKVNKDRYAEIITELVLGEEDKLTDKTNDQGNLLKREPPNTKENLQGVYKHSSVRNYGDQYSEITPLEDRVRRKPSPQNSEPKLSPHSSTTNTKRSPQSDSSSDISVSPSRRPFIETAFVSNSPTRNIQDIEEDLMFRKIESKFSSGPGVFRRQKSIAAEETKPKISPKPDVKTTLPIPKRTLGSSTTKQNPKESPNGNDHLNPIYANDVFFRKKRQQAGQLYSSEVERDAQVYEATPKRENDSKVNGRIGYQVSPSSRETEYQPKGRPVAVAQINSNSVEYRRATQSEANHNHVKSQMNEQDFAQQTNSKFNEYVKDYKDYHPSNRSSSSSTSTIVSEAPWNPDSVDLEKAAISGSPEIRKLRLKQRPEYERAQNGNYNNRNAVERNLFFNNEEQRLRSQLPLKIQTEDFIDEQQYQSGRSGRESAPPAPYYEYSRKLKTPDSTKTLALHHSSPKQSPGDAQDSPRSVSNEPVPHQRHLQTVSGPKSQKYYSLDAENVYYNERPGMYIQPRNQAGQVLVPVGAQMKITSARGDVLRSGVIQGQEPQRASGIPTQQKQSPRSNVAPVKLSSNLTQKQQEQLYYDRMQKAKSLPLQQKQSPRSNDGAVKLSPSNLTQKQQEDIYYQQMQKARSLPAQQKQSPRSNEVAVKLSPPNLTQKQQEEIYYEQMQKTRSLPAQRKPSPISRESPLISNPILAQNQEEEIYIKRMQRTISLPQQNAIVARGNQNVNPNLNRSFSPTGNYRKLSRQEVEQLYWQTQQMRELNAAQLSPRSAQIYMDQYHSTGSLKMPNTLQSPLHINENMDYQDNPQLKVKPLMANQRVSNLKATPLVQSVPNLNRGSPQLVYYADPRGGVLKPQPIYNSQQYNNQAVALNRQMYIQNMNDGRFRSRSVSPGPNNKYFMNQSPRGFVQQSVSPQQSPVGRNLPEQGNFVRGSPQRNTIGAIRSSHPHTLQSTTIYENAPGVYSPEVQLRHPEKIQNEIFSNSKIPNESMKHEKTKSESSKKSKEDKKKEKKTKDKEKDKDKVEQFYPPIFKRGSLSVSNSSVDGSVNEFPSAPKRVSFSSGQDTRGLNLEQVYWPTRNGLAPEPPTRQHKQRPDSTDSEVFLPNSPAGQYFQKGDYIYMNVEQRPAYGMLSHDAPDRPLPPIPAHMNSQYGSINKPRDLKSPVTDSSGKSDAERRVAVADSRPSDFERPAVQAVRASSASVAQSGGKLPVAVNRWQPISESESGSEAGEVQRILQQGNRNITYFRFAEEEWGADGKPRGPPGSDQSGSSGGGRDDEVRRSSGARGSRRDEPRRHTLSGDHHHQGGSLARSMDLEMSSKQRRKSPLPRGYPPPSSAMLFDDDPGIMSEVETSSTGFRRGGKQRSSLPVVRTPSKTLERPLGLVFLQYRNETKRALLPNEITSLDTVRALFVRSFPKQLTMEYLDSHHVKIYIHDSSKDMFYELEDLRSHLRDIRDRSVLRLFESADVNGGVLPGAGVGVAPPIWDQDQSYFSEPEFDSEYQHQHIHKSKTSSKSSGAQPYYMTHSYPPGGAGASATLPRGGSLLRTYSPAVPPPLPADRIKTLPQTDRLHGESGYMSSPERGGSRGSYPPGYLPSGPGSYEDPYYSQYAPRSGSITPVIDEEARASLSRIRVEHMERQLANLTGLVQKALTHTPTPREYLQVPVPSSRDANNYRNAGDDYDKHSSSSSASLPDEAYLRTDTKPPKLGKDKSVSFEKSVSFSDEPPDMNSPKQHSPQHAERNDRDRHKPAPPPKPVSLSPAQYEGRHIYRDLQMTPELYNQLRGLQKKAKDLRTEVRNLRRMSQAQAHSVRETIRDTFIKIRAVLVAGGADAWSSSGDHDKLRLTREEDLYKQEMLRLETDLTELESTVEELRGNVINRKTRVNMSDVENMALILSKSSKTVADLKGRFPGLQDGMKGLITSEMEKVVREEKFLNEEPERLESALRRCKKLTGTLVTLKRLASVQEQRLPPSSTPESRLSPTLGDSDSTPPITPPAHGKAGAVSTRGILAPALSTDSLSRQRPENALDALLDELQTFARPPSNPSLADIGRKGSIDSQHPPSTGGTLRRLHSYPSSSDGGGSSPPTLSRLQVTASPKPPVPERNAELLAQLAGRRQPPPPPPRTSSRSPLASPTSPSLPPRSSTGQPQMGVSGTLRRGAPGRSSLREPLRSGSLSEAPRPTEETNPGFNPLSASNSSSCESVNSQEGLQPKKQRQEVLEQRHQELLRKQKALQEQYARLQQLQRGAGSLSVPQPDLLLLKKTGSESNLLAKMGLGHSLSAAAPISGSLTHLAVASSQPITSLPPLATMKLQAAPASTTTTNKIYETDIL